MSSVALQTISVYWDYVRDRYFPTRWFCSCRKLNCREWNELLPTCWTGCGDFILALTEAGDRSTFVNESFVRSLIKK